jgi:hypothetical protein
MSATGAHTQPFVILSLPRSRSFWLSRYLSYGPWNCGHDEIRHVRSIEDVRSWLSMPYTGTAETAAAPWWRTLRRLAPEMRVMLVRRDPADVFNSVMRLGSFDAATLARSLRRLDAKLDQIAVRWPGALSVPFADLEGEAGCARVFEHCLGMPHDPAWWRAMAALNLQTSLPWMMEYFRAYGRQIAEAAATEKARTVAILRGKRAFEVPRWNRIVPVARRRDYTLGMENVSGQTFFHVEVQRWNARVMRDLQRDRDVIMALHGGPVFTTADKPHDGDRAKWCKFQAVMGFSPAIPTADGQPVYVRWR